MNGDADILQGRLRPQGISISEIQGFMSPADQNAAGKVTALSPWRMLDYWRWTREPDLGDYLLG